MNCWSRFVIFRMVFLLVIFLGSATNRSPANENEWLPIPPEDLTLEDNPACPGSSAMILYKEDRWDHENKVRDLYYRIKIFKKEGRSYADIEIPYNSKTHELKEENIAARTIQPDGRIIEFRGVIFEKTLARTRKDNLLAKTFSLPEIQDGSIVEYRYQIKAKKLEEYFYTWLLQEDLFIREALLSFRPAARSEFKIVGRYANNEANFSKSADSLFQATLRNVPAFENEVYSLPEITQQLRYYIIYIRKMRGIPRNVEYELKKYALEYVNDFIGKPKDVRKITDQLVTEKDTEESKLRKLYAAIQERIRNLSYEELYTKKERKREKLKERKSAKDVWNYGYGDAGEITLLFTALCRAAGFTADAVYVTERDIRLFDRGIPLVYQIDGELVLVFVKSEPVYLDPGTRFAPFGWIPWWKQLVRGLRLSKDDFSEIDVPSFSQDMNVEEHHITVELQPEGSAFIQMTARYTGRQAVGLKNEFFELSKEQKRLQLRERLKELFETADIKDVTWKGLDNRTEAVGFSYNFHVPDFSIVLDTRILVKPALTTKESPFPQWERKHSVYLPNSYIYNKDVQILLPAGFEVEHLPDDSHYKTEFGYYEYKLTNENNSVRFRRKLVMHTSIIPDSKYSHVKLFFDKIAACEQRFLLLRRQ